MAISPRDLVTRIRENNKDTLQHAEQTADKILEQRFGDSYQVSISPKALGNLRGPVREEFIRRYTAVGWEVTYVSDQRDGDFYSFKAKDSRRPYD